MHSGSRAPDTRLQTQVGCAEPGPGDPGRLRAAGHWLRGTSGTQRTQVWSALEDPVGLCRVGGLTVGEGRKLDRVWSRDGEGGELRERGIRGRRHRG